VNRPNLLARCALLLIICMACAAAHAKDIFVATNGNDANSGLTTAQPVRTIAKGSALAQPGDVVRILPGRYNEAIIPARSGAAGKPITYRAHTTTRPVLTHGSARGLDAAIRISGKSHITVDGIDVDGVRAAPEARVNRFALIENATQVIVRNGNFKYANGWAGFSVTGTTSYVTIEDNTIDFVGQYDSGAGTNSDTGDEIEVRHGTIHHVLIQRNKLRHGGHNLIRLDARNSIVQDNNFDNSYRDVLGGDRGGRAATFQGTDNIIQRNFFTGSGQSSDAARNPLIKVEGVGNIARQNVFYNGQNHGIITASGDWSANSTYARIYNNTFYRLGSSAWQIRHYEGTVGQGMFLNNLVLDSRLNPPNSNEDSDVLYSVATANLGATANSKVMTNLFYPGANKVPRVLLQGFDGFLEIPIAEQVHPTLFNGNKRARPTFIVAAPKSIPDFDLVSGSAGVNQGAFLTTTKSGGTSARVPVNDRRYFSDGFGLVPGDLVQFKGSLERIRIVDIDEAASTLVLARSVTFTSGQGIALAYEGSAPDAGAREFGVRRLTAPTNVQAH
jgi:hypothetical protein